MWLTAAATILTAAAAAAGLWAPGLYQDGSAVTAMFRGYDLVTLAIVAPLLVVTMLPALRDRPAAQLLRISALVYCVYNYAYYVFGAQLNAALLLHVAIFTTALYAFVLSLAHLDVPGLGDRFRSKTPARTVAGILLFLAIPLAAIQVTAALSFAIGGTVPEDPSVLVVPPELTRLGAVLDLSLLVPAYTLAAVLLWRRRAWGFVLATVLLASGALHQVSYYAAMHFQNRARIPGAAYDPFEPVILGLFVLAAALLLANVQAPGRSKSPPRPDGRTEPSATR